MSEHLSRIDAALAEVAKLRAELAEARATLAALKASYDARGDLITMLAREGRAGQ